MTISLHFVQKKIICYELNPELVQGYVSTFLAKTFKHHTFHNLDYHVPKPGQHVSKELLLGSNSL